MQDFERYLHEIVVPTVEDFRNDQSNVRIGFLTCVAIDHAVDYLAFPGDRTQWDGQAHKDKRRATRRKFMNESTQFKLASEVANAFKHVKTVSQRGLEASQVYERPPALAGRMMCGVSMLGDATGAVVADGHNLFKVATEALDYLHSKIE